jgi:hypothetical protein
VNSDPGVTQAVLTTAGVAGVDVYPSFGGSPRLFTSGENLFFDNVYNALWFKLAIQIAGFNYLTGTNFKIPQTELGMHGLKNAYRSICLQAVQNGYAAPGSWTSPDSFGNRASLLNNVYDLGFYIYSSPVALQSTADRDDRKAPLVQIALKEAGAIHSSSIIVNVNA